ncbi:hypothetical protein MBLNU457_3722t1 [Dothideomycetes sp. NU457]
MNHLGGLGPLVRMRPLAPSQLPAHPDLAAHQNTGSTPPELNAFLTDVFQEAEVFMTDYMSSHFVVKSENKSAAPSTAGVKLSEKTIPAIELPTSHTPGAYPEETWFARTSIHENKAVAGTASWREFEYGLMDDHSQHEKDYTPDVYDAYKVLSWDGETPSLQIPGYEKIGLSIYEMAHKIPPPLNNRVFSVLVATARSSSDARFLVVQIPVDIRLVEKALYSNGRNKRDGDEAIKRKEVHLGQYVSIERCEVLDDGAKVQWQMGTSSDAGGVLPMFVQKMAVPGAIVKDVSLFMEWIENKRKGKGEGANTAQEAGGWTP